MPAQKSGSNIKVAALGAGLVLVVAACSSSKPAASGSVHTSMSEDMSGSMSESMQLPPGADNMHTSISSPSNGAVITANAVTVAVKATGFIPSCALAGKPVASGGHYHILLDHSLINMYCTPTATVSLQNVSPGMHMLTVVPALNNHTEVEQNGQTISFDYQPSAPLPTITSKHTGSPSITILSPKPGAVLSGSFDVTVRITSFEPSCDLYGKANVAGYGHWHLNIDSATGPMMGMGSMLGMSCTATFHATTAGLAAGQHHTLIALLVDNEHAPLMPAAEARVPIVIG